MASCRPAKSPLNTFLCVFFSRTNVMYLFLSPRIFLCFVQFGAGKLDTGQMALKMFELSGRTINLNIQTGQKCFGQ